MKYLSLFIILVLLPMVLATQYEATLNSDGSTSQIEDNQPVVTTPPTSSSGSSGGGGGSSTTIKKNTPETKSPTFPQEIEENTTKISEDIVYEEGNFFSKINGNNMFGSSGNNQLTGAVIGTNNTTGKGYLAIILALVIGLIITIIFMKVRKNTKRL